MVRPAIQGCKLHVLFAALLLVMFASSALPQSRTGILSLRATFGERGAEIGADLYWRVYAVRGGDAKLVASSDQPKPGFALPPGDYAVHASFGLSTAIRQINLNEIGTSATLALASGGLTVSGYLGTPDHPMATHRHPIKIYIPTGTNSEGKLVSDNLRPGALLYLPEGTYHLVSTYSGTNSVSRSDVKIDVAKVTEVTVNHRAATITLKLVRQTGSGGLAGTQWTIETPGGDIVAEAVGTYSVIARLNDREFRAQLKVEGGINRDFEIVMD